MIERNSSIWVCPSDSRKHLFFIICFIAQLGFLHAQDKTKTPFIIGETVSFHSEVLDESRSFNIYLPASYHPDSTRKYPVIYLLDGSKSEDFIHISGLVQFGSFPWIDMVPESIVVGISNVDRKRDFTYQSSDELDRKEFPTSGGADNFIEFIASELQPYITRNYIVSNQKTIIGQSLGGLLATQILMEHPTLFTHYIIISQSLWWDKGGLLKQSIKQESTHMPSIYLGVGEEGEIMVEVAKQLYAKLKEELRSTADLYFKYFEELDHGDTLHLAVYDAFKKLHNKDE